MMHRLAVAGFVGSALLCFAPGARAESPPLPTCKCDDDCKNKWPYTGMCIQYSWGKYCGYTSGGPSVPCTDGGPPPDIAPPKPDKWPGCGDAMPHCKCDDDCKPFGYLSCIKHPTSGCLPICSHKPGPGIACPIKRDIGVEGPATPYGCRCNQECAVLAATPYCAYHSGAWFCSAVGPGNQCPVDEVGPPRRDFGNPPNPRAEGGVGADPPPRGGCSFVAGAAAEAGAGALCALALAALLARRRRR
jgi:hypothetical protein